TADRACAAQPSAAGDGHEVRSAAEYAIHGQASPRDEGFAFEEVGTLGATGKGGRTGAVLDEAHAGDRGIDVDARPGVVEDQPAFARAEGDATRVEQNLARGFAVSATDEQRPDGIAIARDREGAADTERAAFGNGQGPRSLSPDREPACRRPGGSGTRHRDDRDAVLGPALADNPILADYLPPIGNVQLAPLAHIDASRCIPDGPGTGDGCIREAEGVGVKATDRAGAGLQTTSVRDHEITLGCVGASNVEGTIEAQRRTAAPDFQAPCASAIAYGDGLYVIRLGHAHDAAVDDEQLARAALGAERDYVSQRPACAARDDYAACPARIADVSAVTRHRGAVGNRHVAIAAGRRADEQILTRDRKCGTRAGDEHRTGAAQPYVGPAVGGDDSAIGNGHETFSAAVGRARRAAADREVARIPSRTGTGHRDGAEPTFVVTQISVERLRM